MSDEFDSSVAGFDCIDESDISLEDFDVLSHQDVAQFNTGNILPQDRLVLDNLRTWINPTQYAGDGSEYQRHSAAYLKGTSQWALTSPEFRQWQDSLKDGILWVRGIPGSGKSVLASTFIGHLSNDAPVLYFFFRHSIESNRRPNAAVRDWLSQILMSSPPLQLALTKEMTKPVDSLTIGKLWEFLWLALENTPKAYFVVDALDEMDHASLQLFVKLLNKLSNLRPKEVKVIITSRPIANIQSKMRGVKVLDIRLDKTLIEPDINAYLWHKLNSSHLNPKSFTRIVDSILRKADGLFLYAKLAIDTVLEVHGECEALETLERLPTHLSAMYRELLRENLERTGLSMELQILVLQLVTHATRPLRLLEISDCIRVTQPQYGDDIGRIKDIVRSVCGSLIEVLPDETVCIVHHSLVEYILGINVFPGEARDSPVIESGPTHVLITILSLSYLGSGSLSFVKTKHDIWDRIKGRTLSLEPGQVYSPFTSYAGSNWFIHLKKAIESGCELSSAIDTLYKLLVVSEKQNAAKLTLLGKIGMPGRQSNGELLAPEFEALHIAIELGLVSFADFILCHHGDKILKYDGGEDNQPLLHHAVNKGNAHIVRLFLKHGVDLDEYDSHGRTPLHVAVRFGFNGQINNTKSTSQVARILLEAGADPWKREGRDKHVADISFGRGPSLPPIRSAFAGNDEKMAEVFFLFIRDAKDASLALYWAIHGHRKMEIIQMILSLSYVDINAKESRELPFFPITPLFAACTMRDLDLISILLDAGAEPNIPHYEKTSYNFDSSMIGYNALHALAYPPSNPGIEYSRKKNKVNDETIRQCFKVVIEAGGNVNQVNRDKESPLHVANDPVSVICLLEAGASLEATDSQGRTLLQRTNDIKIIEVLLPKLNINAKLSQTGETLLTGALVAKNVNFAIRLLNQGADATVIDAKGNGVLHHAAMIPGIGELPNRTLLERLVKEGADPNIRNSKGKTPLEVVVNSFSFEEARFANFMDIINPDLENIDAQNRTITFGLLDEWDSQRENYALCFLSIMAKRGARFDATDSRGRTLLHAAIRISQSSGALIKFLVENGVNPNQSDLEGNTIWHEAARWFPFRPVHQQVFTDLTDLGIDFAQANRYGTQPFHVVCRFKKALPDDQPQNHYPCAFHHFRETKPEVINCTDSDGVAPLHITSTFSEKLTRTLLGLGADISLATHEKLTVLHLAARSRRVDVLWLLIDWLRSNGTDQGLAEMLDARDVQGRTPLYYACASGNKEVVQLLLESGSTADTETFIGSIWNGIADFEDEQRNWVPINPSGSSVHHDNPFYQPDAGGVLISDNLRPKLPYGESGSYPVEQIDSIIGILARWGLESDCKLIDEAIEYALQKRREYTAKCLSGVRESLSSRLEIQDNRETEGDSAFKLLHRVIPGFSQDVSSEKRDAIIHEAILGVIDSGDLNMLQRILSVGQINVNLRTPGEEAPSWTSTDGRSMRSARHDPQVKKELYVLDYLASCEARRANNYEVAVGTRMLNLLLEHGADLNSRYHCTTLMHRILEGGPISGHTPCGESPYLKLMLKHPSLDVEAVDGSGRTLLLLACALVDVPAAEALLARGASITVRDGHDRNVLHQICSHPHLMSGEDQWNIRAPDLSPQGGLLNRLIQLAPGLLHQIDQDGNSPLLCALGQGTQNPQLGQGIAVLLSGGADVTAANPKTGETPLHLLFGGSWDIDATDGDDSATVCGRRCELMDDFLARGADINARDRFGETPVFRFMRTGTVNVKLPSPRFERLPRDKNCLIAQEDQRQVKAEAAVRLEFKLMNVFDRVGVDWNCINTKRQSLLHAVASRSNYDREQVGRKLGSFRFLVDKGLECLGEDDEHRSPLDFAAATGAEDILEFVKRENGHSRRNL